MKGYLVLETGEIFTGTWLGGTSRAAEVVFNTSHSGYEEIATDPSYFKQMVVMTSPMQGNYGVCSDHWESSQMWIDGFICLQMQSSPSESTWVQRLISNGIPVVCEIDTRRIALRLRSGGTPWGALVNAPSETDAKKKAF
jgi:carbamoyl-phosphate synthase small subunit